MDKSKLRQVRQDDIDPQYRGARVGRQEALSDDSDDPFLDAEEVESAEYSESDAQESDAEIYRDEESETDQTEMSEDMEDIAPVVMPTIDRAELRQAMKADRHAVTASVLAARKSDAEKGRAAKRQRTTYDSFLNVRIKMQKSLIASNSLVAISSDTTPSNMDITTLAAFAESLAYNLWSRLTAYREQLTQARSGTAVSDSGSVSQQTASSTLVRQQQQLDDLVSFHRNAVLQKWSLKSRSVTAGTQQSKINTDQPATIVDVLNEHLSNTERLLQRARTPRSCAPVQLAQRVSEDRKIYDDADFYGLLLKELLEAKSSASANAAANVDIKSFINIQREAKTKKIVDTKASKGRKMKYTVHEKLQNWCAPDDKTTWSGRQRDELFSSLFGQRSGLQEDQQSDENDSDIDPLDASLMLFRGDPKQ